MSFREPTPYGTKGPDNLPVLVLPEGTLLKGAYQTHFLTVGGMSIVYTAVKGGETYLLKEVEASDSRKVIALTQEKFMLERLNHPGIVKVYEIFEEDGFYYLVLEYVDGSNLETQISPFPDVFLQEQVVMNWALQLCDILEHLHGQSPPIIYRDLKPRNVIKDKSGRLHLVDFGIARVWKDNRMRDTELMGSALTASPEHYGGAQTDERSDVFTLGATLHYLLTNGRGLGDEPFEFRPIRSINPKVSERTEQIIMRALALDPTDRYQTMGELRCALSVTGDSRQDTKGSSKEFDKHRLAGVQAAPDDERAAPTAPLDDERENPRDWRPWMAVVGALLLVLISWAFIALRPPQRSSVPVAATESPSSPGIEATPTQEPPESPSFTPLETQATPLKTPSPPSTRLPAPTPRASTSKEGRRTPAPTRTLVVTASPIRAATPTPLTMSPIASPVTQPSVAATPVAPSPSPAPYTQRPSTAPAQATASPTRHPFAAVSETPSPSPRPSITHSVPSSPSDGWARRASTPLNTPTPSPSERAPPPSERKQQPAQGSWEGDANFQVFIPAGYHRFGQGPEGGLRYIAGKPGDSSDPARVLGVLVADPGRRATLDEAAGFHRDILMRRSPARLESRDTVINGVRGKEFIADALNPRIGQMTRNIQVLFVSRNGTTVYILSAETGVRQFERFAPEFSQFLNSFKLLN